MGRIYMITPHHYHNAEKKCAVCDQTIKGNANYRHNIVGLWLVCKECRARFSKDEITLMINLFIAYGGYFGRDEQVQEGLTFQQKLELLNIQDKEFMRKNAKPLHDALLLGISPAQLSIQ